MINWLYDTYRILSKVYGEKTYIKQAISEVDIEEANRALTVKTCYGVLDKEIELNYYVKYLADKTPKLAVRTVIKIAMYAMKYLQKKSYTVINNSVELVKKLGKGGASGFVNAFLRKFAITVIPLPVEKIPYLSVKYSYPEFAVKKLVDFYGEDVAEQIIKAPFADNALAFYHTDGYEYLTAKGADFSETPFDNVFTVKNFVRDDGFDKGIYTYQSLGSVAICDVVETVDKVLDCCAAPGGKSVRLSYRCGSVTAWDIHPHRVELINAYANRMNRTNITATVKDAKLLDESYIDAFDACLCDAPCSGFGVINENPDMRLNRTEENLKELIKEQESILNAVCKYVKKGGYLYYSTCSVLPEENIKQAKNFLKDHPNYKMCQVISPLWGENHGGAMAFLPHISRGQGFFIAKFMRVE